TQRRCAEDEADELAEHPVQDRDEEHHEQDEAQHHQGVIDQLLPRRSDDLLEFCHNLAEELQDSSEESELLGTGGTAGCAASLLCRCVGHTSSLGRFRSGFTIVRDSRGRRLADETSAESTAQG